MVTLIAVIRAAKAISNRDNPIYYSMKSKKSETKITEFFSLIRRSKPLRSLLWATCSDSIAKSVRASLTIYLFANIIMNRGLTSVFDILKGIPAEKEYDRYDSKFCKAKRKPDTVTVDSGKNKLFLDFKNAKHYS